MSDDLHIGSLEPMEFTFAYDGKDYTLREPSEEADMKVIAFLNFKMVDGKMVPDAQKTSEAGSYLLGFCIFDADNKLVPLATIRSWPSRTVRLLSKKAQEMQRAVQEETAEAIEARITQDQQKLAMIRESGGVAKNSFAGMAGTSASATH